MKWNNKKLFGRGTHIADRQDEDHNILLYQIDGFDVEVFYHRELNVIRRYRPFKSVDQLRPYLDQIDSSGVLLPKLSNQRLNSYLKEISDICRFNKELIFHCARHTFATTLTLTNGVPIETVGKMLGHRSLRTTQIYAKILDSKVSNDMKELKIEIVQSYLATSINNNRYIPRL